MSGLDSPVIELSSIVVESSIYGLFFVAFLACHYVLLSRRRTRFQGKLHLKTPDVNWALLVLAIITFMLVSVHWSLDIMRLIRAFIQTPAQQGMSGAQWYYADISAKSQLAKLCILFVEESLADSLLVWRLWVIWNKNTRICALPIFTVLGWLVTSIGEISHLAAPIRTTSFHSTAGQHWMNSAFAMTFTTNIYCSESAATYTGIALASWITYGVKTSLQFLVMNAAPAIIGLNFYLVVIRVGLGFGFQHSDGLPGVPPPPSGFARTGSLLSIMSKVPPIHEKMPVQTYPDPVKPPRYARDEDEEKGSIYDIFKASPST
ncbi:hypothetical protein PUNSTDRAFT_42077 [Punctularia strigosozonata HHB-11173 SS5]|uniref:uncharacterized protein n=1 Tax=Punctularia strigosozonata (strain HHB-11173) TaxID=741275 RepID=UPI0004417FC2|nr:uncharacterized protein PUNSTDRAFT_42077 [Punctularia strigosozonata HHB-11173 SS5]EIN12466.1 hypothetical protein PUNSTDRAFT_42077 [Punctularia strigosozonata HHB-11173 SS5]